MHTGGFLWCPVIMIDLYHYDIESKLVLPKESPEVVYTSIQFELGAEFCH